MVSYLNLPQTAGIGLGFSCPSSLNHYSQSTLKHGGIFSIHCISLIQFHSISIVLNRDQNKWILVGVEYSLFTVTPKGLCFSPKQTDVLKQVSKSGRADLKCKYNKEEFSLTCAGCAVFSMMHLGNVKHFLWCPTFFKMKPDRSRSSQYKQKEKVK